MKVRSHVRWGKLTDEEKATIRMWKAIGLSVQAKRVKGSMPKNVRAHFKMGWNSAGEFDCELYGPDWYYRLKPDERS